MCKNHNKEKEFVRFTQNTGNSTPDETRGGPSGVSEGPGESGSGRGK